jgi:hypothetical protein
MLSHPPCAGRAPRLALLLCSLLLASAPPSWAQPAPAPSVAPGTPLYSVEIIVFRASTVGAAEDWNAKPAPRGFGAAAPHEGPPAQVLRVLGASDYHLGNLESGLRTSGSWLPVAHAAWVQSASNWGSNGGIALADVGIDVPGLSGTVFLERAPIYLHLGFEVTLSAEGNNYAIDEMRSVRYNNALYFDHPAFGIIAVVSPIKRAEG